MTLNVVDEVHSKRPAACSVSLQGETVQLTGLVSSMVSTIMLVIFPSPKYPNTTEEYSKAQPNRGKCPVHGEPTEALSSEIGSQTENGLEVSATGQLEVTGEEATATEGRLGQGVATQPSERFAKELHLVKADKTRFKNQFKAPVRRTCRRSKTCPSTLVATRGWSRFGGSNACPKMLATEDSTGTLKHQHAGSLRSHAGIMDFSRRPHRRKMAQMLLFSAAILVHDGDASLVSSDGGSGLASDDAQAGHSTEIAIGDFTTSPEGAVRTHLTQTTSDVLSPPTGPVERSSPAIGAAATAESIRDSPLVSNVVPGKGFGSGWGNLPGVDTLSLLQPVGSVRDFGSGGGAGPPSEGSLLLVQDATPLRVFGSGSGNGPEWAAKGKVGSSFRGGNGSRQGSLDSSLKPEAAGIPSPEGTEHVRIVPHSAAETFLYIAVEAAGSFVKLAMTALSQLSVDKMRRAECQVVFGIVSLALVSKILVRWQKQRERGDQLLDRARSQASRQDADPVLGYIRKARLLEEQRNAPAPPMVSRPAAPWTIVNFRTYWQ